ncbi:DUF4349 domain-containing protein [Nocardioides sp. MAH-18]|uniref:DUF4349 domain-containing protein n=1 Tax=Nocardioides agri TaxID=2682843 RepID=A0A6L6XUG2_9ACTN|nr:MULTISPECIES: DUF4349 domain-containing protein [unclassified Nocardioides]MBA2955982.1 DUF4349 domain-containing protein [Nocardioides sp. CGMCC 1.13656]MVQ50830.1 DUF4349 domain-containing protein [Nocardioides sp. MAH-18]
MTHRTARTLVATAALAALLLTGCSSDSDDGGSNDSSSAAAMEPAAPDRDGGGDAVQGLASDAEAGSSADGAAEDAAARDEAPVDPADGVRRAVIRTGDLSMRAEDVGQARFAVQRIADRYRGEVTEENTQSDDDGDPAYARMVLRVPSDDFDEAVAALEEVGEDVSVSTSADDVTTKLIDLRSRVETQRRSIARITVLFEQARSIRDIMSIEAELSRRQAELESLERKQAYLAGQSSMSTITVGIERIPDEKKKAKADDGDGFLAGLTAGWGALKTFGIGAATVVGALLPWLVVLALVGIPVWLLVRSMRRRAPEVTPVADGPQDSA